MTIKAFRQTIFAFLKKIIGVAYYPPVFWLIDCSVYHQAKLKESQYQLAPWRSDALSNNTNFTPQSPTYPYGVALTATTKNGLEIVPQQPYSHSQTPSSSPLKIWSMII
ncbi:hypothetical protein H6P81_017693 [Aristolochia fimbriata]|uniref:Uncharacterized protein n=1 Tax=Aristolochia fimbriata TaxID=158543 RepID=A0AAV7DZW7_ARIFI|nr:hypothetical protein H6P81_017693 [Aristolochia fimbriata]